MFFKFGCCHLARCFQYIWSCPVRRWTHNVIPKIDILALDLLIVNLLDGFFVVLVLCTALLVAAKEIRSNQWSYRASAALRQGVPGL